MQLCCRVLVFFCCFLWVSCWVFLQPLKWVCVHTHTHTDAHTHTHTHTDIWAGVFFFNLFGNLNVTCVCLCSLLHTSRPSPSPFMWDCSSLTKAVKTVNSGGDEDDCTNLPAYCEQGILYSERFALPLARLSGDKMVRLTSWNKHDETWYKKHILTLNSKRLGGWTCSLIYLTSAQLVNFFTHFHTILTLVRQREGKILR